MGDGSTLAFFASPGLPPTPAVPTPAFNNFNHIALQVPSRADADHWREWLEQNGVEIRPVDHLIIYSLYFQDPNGVRLEITATLDETWNEQPEAADTLLAGWAATKASAQLAAFDTGNCITVAYNGSDGWPHVSRRGTTQVIDDHTLAILVRKRDDGLATAISDRPQVTLLYVDLVNRPCRCCSAAASHQHPDLIESIRDVRRSPV